MGFRNIPHFDGVVCSAAHKLVLFDWTKIQCIYFAGMSINVMLRTIWVPYIPNLYWIEMWGGQVFTGYSFPTNLSVQIIRISWSEDFLKQVIRCFCFMNSRFFLFECGLSTIYFKPDKIILQNYSKSMSNSKYVLAVFQISKSNIPNHHQGCIRRGDRCDRGRTQIFRYLNPIPTMGGRFCPPLQRSNLNFPCDYIPDHPELEIWISCLLQYNLARLSKGSLTLS